MQVTTHIAATLLAETTGLTDQKTLMTQSYLILAQGSYIRGSFTLKLFWAFSNDITADQVLISKPFRSKEFVV